MTVQTRFAPSPTGKLHLGHALSALVAYDLASKNHGEFILRFEDIDHTRVRSHYYREIEEDLHWLGITWKQKPWSQLDRLKTYQKALDELRLQDLVYPCFCTRREIDDELAQMTQAPHGPDGSHYPGICRDLTESQINDLLKTRIPSWRLNSQKAAHLATKLTFTDLKHGKIEVNALLLGDVVLARKDIGCSYHLAVCLDDAAQGITHVTRGCDLLPATHLHRVLQQLLKLPEPIYLHHELVLDEDGQRLAKRHQSQAISTLRDQGMSQAEVRSMLSSYQSDLAPLMNL